MRLGKKKVVLISLGVFTLLVVAGVGGFFAVEASRTPQEKAERYYAKAQSFFDDGQETKARLEIRNALQLDENNSKAWFLLAQLSEKRADWKGLLRYATRTIQLDPTHVDARLKLGQLYLAGKQIDKALEQSDELLKLDDKNARAHAFRGAVLFRLDDIDGALKELKIAEDLDPKNLDRFLHLAAIQLAQKKQDEALKTTEQGMAAHPTNVSLHMLKIGIFELTSNYEKAVGAYEDLIKLQPKQPLIRQALINLHVRFKKTEAAENVYRDMIKNDPKNTGLKLAFVGFVEQRNGAAAAVEALEGMAKAEPENADIQLALARRYALTRKFDDAKNIYRKIIERSGNEKDGLSAKNRLAGIIRAEGDVALADKMIEEIIEFEPRNSEALLYRAATRLSKFNSVDAIVDLRSVLRDTPDNAAALRLLARAHIQRGANDLATDRYQQAIVKNPDRLDIRMEFANFLLRNNDGERAQTVVEAILAQRPNYIPAMNMLLQLRVNAQDWASAENIAKEIEKISGNKSFTGEVLGTLYQAQNKLDLSIDAYKAALEISPNSTSTMRKLVQTYLRAGRRDEAKSFLQTVLKASGSNLVAQIMLGQIAVAESQWDVAEKQFRSAIDGNPANAAGYLSMMNLHQQRKNDTAAIAALKEGLSAIPGDVSLSVALAGIHERRKEIDEAIKIYERVVAENPGANVAVNNLASLISDHRTDRESLTKALRLADRYRNSQIPHFRDTLGWINHRLGQHSRAIRMLEGVVKDSPNTPTFRYHLGMAYLAVENNDRAKAELEKAISLAKDGFPEMDIAKAALERLKNPG